MAEQGRHSRRQILKATLGTAGLALGAPVWRLAGAVAQTPDAARVERLTDDLFVVSIPGEANVVAQTSDDGVLLVDGGSAGASDALMKAVAGLPGGGPVHTLFNTHWHPEQTGSNETLGKAGRTIIAHENTRLWLTTDVVWPWNGRALQAPAEGRAAEQDVLHHRRRSTRASATATSPTRRTPTAISTCTSRSRTCSRSATSCAGAGWPVVDYATGGWIGGIVGGLQRLQTLANAKRGSCRRAVRCLR